MEMNISINQEWQNPWDAREKFPPVSLKFIIIAAVACFLCAVGIPLASNQAISGGILIVLFAYVVYMGKSPLTVAMILTTAVLVTMVGLGFSAACVILSIIVGISSLSYLFTAVRRGWLFAPIPFVGFAIAFAITKNFEISLTALLFLPAAAMLAFSTLAHRGKTASVCAALIGLILTILTALCALIYKVQGTLSLETIKSFFDLLREEVVQSFFVFRSAYFEALESTGVTQDDAMLAQIRGMLSDDMLRNMVGQIFNLLPAIVTVVCSILAFEAQTLQNATYRTTGLRLVLTLEARIFTMSVTAAVLFVLAFLVQLIAPATSMAGAVAQNIGIIFVPGFCAVAVSDILAIMIKMRGGAKVFFILLLFMLCCGCFSGGLLYVLAMWGAYGVISAAIRKKLIEKIEQSNHQGPDASNR